jgi:hypothetical protein
MTRPWLALVVLIGVAVTASSAPAQGLNIFKRRSKPDTSPATKVKQLAETLRASPDEGKRKQAAEDLREFDPRSNPDLIPALMGAVQKDPVPGVRSAAAESIGKLKPVSQPAGLTLEAVAQADPDAGVREAAKQALWQYHLNGYRPPTTGPLAPQSAEPPLAAKPVSRPGKPAPPPATGFRPITNSVGKGLFFPQTSEPPLARPKPPAAPAKEPAKPTTVLPPPQPAAQVPQPMPPAAAAPSTPPPAAPSVPSGPLPPISIPQAGGSK